MDNLQIFHHSDFGEIGVILIDGHEYFPATACAKILGYTNPRKAISDHCKSGEPWVTKRDAWVQTGVKADGTPAMRKNQVNYINEGNLYRLITHSKLPAAQKFERWIFDEVLPTIRKTGSYAPTVDQIPLDTVMEIVQVTATTMATEFIKQIVPLIRQPAEAPESSSSDDGEDIDIIHTTTIVKEVTRKRRSNGKVAKLPANLRSDVEIMLSNGVSYREITEYLATHGHIMSQMAICTHAKKIGIA